MRRQITLLVGKHLSEYSFIRKLKDISHSPEDLTDLQFREINTFILGITSIIIIAFCLFANVANARPDILYLLTFLLAIKSTSLYALYKKKLSVNFVQPISISILAFLGYYILITDSYDASGSLVWFIIFPPMTMFTMGLHLGSLVSFAYFISLCLLTLTPLNFLMNNCFAQEQLVRFLIAYLGSFIFSYCTEYVRHKTKSALINAYRQNKQYALTDSLTGLKNRRSFDSIIPNTLEELKSKQSPYTIMFLDIDYFKSINDTYGHDIGDIVLQHLSQILLSQKNASDFAFRWGGEEFVLLMPNLNKEQAEQVAERIRQAIESTPCNVDENSIRYTASIGYFTSDHTNNIEQAIKQADKNLYTAKARGRNRTVGSV